MDFPGWDGFLGTRASLVMDLVVVAMLLVVVVLLGSIRCVRRGRYLLHKRLQLFLAAALLVAVTLFEIDVRVNGWRERAAGELGANPSNLVFVVLYIHLLFAISSVVSWPIVIARAWKNFPNPPAPNEHSSWHRRWAKVAAWSMILTGVTGWVFYLLAFVL